jgi:predicted nucleic acid-binding protein
MRVVIADTSPIHYLVLIRAIHLRPALFERVALPVTKYRFLAANDLSG